MEVPALLAAVHGAGLAPDIQTGRATYTRKSMRAEQLFRNRHEWWLPGAAKLGSKEHERAVIYGISIDRVTGRRAARGRADVPALAAFA